MIEQGQAYTFDFLHFRRDFRNRSCGEVFMLELEALEKEWAALNTMPRDGIGAINLKWPDECKSISVGFTAFFRRHKNPLKAGEMFFLELHISQDDWIRCRDYVGLGLGVASIIWTARAIEEEKPIVKKQRERKAKEPSPYGAFWQRLHTFHNRFDVRHWLGFDQGQEFERAALDKFYAIFEVESRTEIDPAVLLRVLEMEKKKGANLDGAISQVSETMRRLGMLESGVM